MMDDSLNENEGRNRKEMRQTVIQLTIDRSFLTKRELLKWTSIRNCKRIPKPCWGMKGKSSPKPERKATDFQNLEEGQKISKNSTKGRKGPRICNKIIYNAMPNHIIYKPEMGHSFSADKIHNFFS